MNIFNIAKDLKCIEKMIKPALEKFMKDSGFVKKDVLDKLEKRVSELERSVKDLNNK
jgi:polyhydroxyalkanoate synthesis regulator phasin